MLNLSISKSRTIILYNSRRRKKRKEKRTHESKLTIFQNQKTSIIHKIDKDDQIIQNSTITIFQITALIHE